eukprot:maker-scaffold_19-snap-gene-4.42-mRNA-1 protein AED:0.00 eAED:0.00 QI:56/0.5/0.66/1/1/1/3/135/313
MRRKQRASTQMTSMKTFLKFIYRDSTGVLIQESIISKECFNLWIETRASNVKYPLQAFKRTISSHLRGADQRAPFSADVEASLLRKYRARDLLGRQIDPFSFSKSQSCIKKSALKLSQYSFPYGYHEKKRVENEESSNLVLVDKKVLKTMEDMIGLSVTDLTLLHQAAEVANLGPVTTLVSYLLPKMRKKVKYFSPEYILPENSYKYFLELETFVVDNRNMTVVNDSRKKLRNAKGKHFFAIGVGLTEFFSIFMYVNKKLDTDGYCWFRSVFTLEGKHFIAISHVKRKEHIDSITLQILLDEPIYDWPPVLLD